VTFTRDGGYRAKYLPGPGDGELTCGPAWFPDGPAVPDGTFDDRRDMSSGADFGAAPPDYSLTFPKEGTYRYACQIHAGMQGTITVLPTAASLPEPPAQAQERGL